MKHRILSIICILAISLFGTTACASGRLLPNLKKQEGLTSVYVGKALLNMAGMSGGFSVPGVNMVAMSKNLDSIEIITAETTRTVRYLSPLAGEAINNIKGLELAMENEEGDSSTRIYVKLSPDGKSYTRMIILVSEQSEYTIIDMQGTLPLDAISAY